MRAGQIRGVTPIDRTPSELKSERQVADRLRKQRTRKAQESSPARLKAWERIGIGQTKFKALKRAGSLPEWPVIPRGVDPEPYIAAWALAFKIMHDPASNGTQVAT